MIEITLTDSTTTHTFQALEPPLTISPIEGVVDVVTLDNNMSSYFTANKRLWQHTWRYMTEAEYGHLKGFYDRQWTLFQYPTVTITAIGVTGVPVRLTLSPQQIIDNCETVEDATITMRESRLMPEGS